MQPYEKISSALTTATEAGRVALLPFVTAGYPERQNFISTLRKLAAHGVPFTDPMADGVTIQRSSHAALASGVTLHWILDELAAATDIDAPVVLMSYLNPLLAYGFEKLAARATQAGVCGFIVPDLPYEESAEFRAVLDQKGLALIQLVTPATPDTRLRQLCQASKGFVYAVTVTGITGGAQELPAAVTGYLDRVKSYASIPVCAGFGVRTAEQVVTLGGHADGVIVGSALVEQLEAGKDPGDFLEALSR
jgi:tryptophan synthase alpha chain